MATTYDVDRLTRRKHDLARGIVKCNGIKRVVVALDGAAVPPCAWLDVEFYNDQYLSKMLLDINSNAVPPTAIFSIRGGSRIPAGSGLGQVQVVTVTTGGSNCVLRLKVQPIGDYSTYTLTAAYEDVVLDSNNNVVRDENNNPLLESKIDPLFASVDFKFRPGCFNTNCAPVGTWEAPPEEPAIDYLAKDFDSFKHSLINAMRERVPGWQPTSEADLDQVLIDLIAADADELSDFQDRVMNEAYFGRALKRVSLARHARFVDYHIHQGNQAGTWVAVKVTQNCLLPRGFGVWIGENWQDDQAIIFATTQDRDCFTDLNELQLYTWGGIITALEGGTKEADIVPPAGTAKWHADSLRDLFRRGDATALVIEEKLNPETGTEHGRDKTARQLLRLLDGDSSAETIHDPVNGCWVVRVHWREEDRLRRRYCFITQCPNVPAQEGVSAFHGNVIRVTHGRPHTTTFHSPGAALGPDDNSDLERTGEAHYENTPRWGVVCRLPYSPLAYEERQIGDDGWVPSTVRVEVSGFAGDWMEQKDLIESNWDDTDFVVETDELGISTIRFGNGVNGLALPQGAIVTCHYQVGLGSSGNVGADSLTGFDTIPASSQSVEAIWNPFDVIDGRDPETPAEIVRRVPHAYRARQLRAITLEDYTKRAEELSDVSHAYARYAWTGSWRTVCVAIDPKGSTELREELRIKVAKHLDAVRLIGEDLEVRCARYVALDILLRLCVHPDYWPEDLAHELASEFSDGYTADGRTGLFHPDCWTFGQPLHASQLVGRALAVKGVERVLLVSMRRWNAGPGEGTSPIIINPEDLPETEIDTLEVKPFEIIQVANDPSHLERGRIQFEILGGRR